MAVNAKDVQALRQATGAGMMDCKKALEESAGDYEAAKKWLREKGLAASAKRAERESNQGVVALSIECPQAAIVKVKCETDFVASSESFVAEAQALADLVRAKGEAAVAERSQQIEDLKILLKENIDLGEVVRFEAAPGNVMDSYIHMQGGRGVNVVVVEMKDASEELAHDIAVHIAFARPSYLTREEVPADVIAAEKATLETATRNEGKPEAAIAKIVEGRLNGFFKDIVLLEQPYAKDDKKSVKDVIGKASIVRYAQVFID
jgi:elongation factor Ts